MRSGTEMKSERCSRLWIPVVDSHVSFPLWTVTFQEGVPFTTAQFVENQPALERASAQAYSQAYSDTQNSVAEFGRCTFQLPLRRRL